MSQVKKVAVVDDDLEMAKLVEDILKSRGYAVTRFTSASEALANFKKNPPQVLITDYKMKDINGMMLIKKVQEDYPHSACIMMTAFGSIETAVEAMKPGAYHYIVKPFNMEELCLITARATERVQLQTENTLLKRELKKTFSIDSVIGKSQPMQELFELIKRVAPAMANILITGESGTGKELVARAVHNLGNRSKKPFVAINCTAIPEHLLESELFGHVKGSFTGAIADKKGLFDEAQGGTLFLDEIGDLSLPLQGKLLRVIQEKEIRSVGGGEVRAIDVRIVCATHRNLKTMVKDGRFREDLFYRINVIPVYVPALRDRSSDIPLLVASFIKKYATQNNSQVTGILPDAMAKLVSHPWPGNVRELENLIERAVVLSSNKYLTEKEVMTSALETVRQTFQELYSDNPTLDKLEERYIKLILGQSGTKKDVAAKILGVNRRTLYRKEREYGLVADDTKESEEDPQS